MPCTPYNLQRPCRLTSLPKVLGNMTHLQHLAASSNAIQSLPNSIGHLQQLQRLDLRSNYLDALPEVRHCALCSSCTCQLTGPWMGMCSYAVAARVLTVQTWWLSPATSVTSPCTHDTPVVIWPQPIMLMHDPDRCNPLWIGSEWISYKLVSSRCALPWLRSPGCSDAYGDLACMLS